MKEKSKFMTFLLSFLPGLSHLYLGFGDRGIVFLMVFIMAILGVTGLVVVTSSEGFFVLLVFALPIIWLIALVDAFSLRKRYIINEYNSSREKTEEKDKKEIEQSNKKTITLALSIIPGAGHMYLGQQKKGLIIMGIFFFTIFFMGWLNLSLFLFVLPLVWFYGFFDAFHSFNGSESIDEKQQLILPNIKPQWIGWGLITIGILVILERIAFPLISIFISHEIRNYIQTLFVSLTFIIVGIELLNRNKAIKDESDSETLNMKDEFNKEESNNLDERSE